MNNTPQWIKAYWDKNPAKYCERVSEGVCSGRLTKEHAFIYAGKQIQELWAVIDLCWYHHLGAGMNKNINEKIALSKATDEDLAKYPKKDWQQLKKRYGLCN